MVEVPLKSKTAIVSILEEYPGNFKNALLPWNSMGNTLLSLNGINVFQIPLVIPYQSLLV